MIAGPTDRIENIMRKLTEPEIVVATHNAGKLKEINELIEPFGPPEATGRTHPARIPDAIRPSRASAHLERTPYVAQQPAARTAFELLRHVKPEVWLIVRDIGKERTVLVFLDELHRRRRIASR